MLAGGVFAIGQFNLRLANQISPGLTLAVAMFSYLVTVLALGLVLAASRPTVVDPVAIAVGLVVGVVGWVGRLIDLLRVRPKPPPRPVNISGQHERNTWWRRRARPDDAG